jgi:hypothetical protein
MSISTYSYSPEIITGQLLNQSLYDEASTDITYCKVEVEKTKQTLEKSSIIRNFIYYFFSLNLTNSHPNIKENKLPQCSPCFYNLRNIILNFSKSLPNYSIDEGEPASTSLIFDALTMLSKFKNTTEPPIVGYSGDGEITFDWKHDKNNFLIISFSDDELYSYYATIDGKEYLYDDANVNDSIDTVCQHFIYG